MFPWLPAGKMDDIRVILGVHGRNLLAVRDFFNEETGVERREDEHSNITIAEPPKPKENSIADVFERVLDKEFPDKDPQEGTEGEVGSSFNSSVADQQAVLETVARVSNHKKNETEVEHDKSKSFQLGDLINLLDGGSEELPTLIDKKDNVFVISNPRSGYMVLQQDLRCISDPVMVIVLAMNLIHECSAMNLV